jgi:tetratricopeptide (TPR) repeat protein
MKVHAWHEKVVIPTYEIGKPEKNPIFLEKRVYQGSSGVVYPHPVIEKISDEKVDKEWNAVYLENDFVKIMILPELGGRVQMAYDKTKQRHFVYYNQVIKPALVGLAGPWISGGIEFNWPQHHRPSTYDPVDCKIEENKDGSITVWCSEIEKMFRTRGMAGFTLHPDKSYLEIKVKLYNRTSVPQTFLWWANPAVKVNDEYQSVFPPDVNAVFDHGKRDVSKFPIATGTYYKMDYSAGVDISRYKNIPVPTSYMAIRSQYNFVGGYENDTKGGLLHVANHHVSPGKKQWTWGNSDFGQAWDRNLTDEDGPYIELMCGVYTDNQPDFSWLMPYEEKSFTQYFMPYRDLGVVKNASKDAMLNLEFGNGRAIVKVYTTGIYPAATIKLIAKGNILFKETFDLHPAVSFEKAITIDNAVPKEEFAVEVRDAKGKLLIAWKPEKEGIKPIPDAAKPAKEPKEVSNNEQLYLTGLHLEQYRHATYNPADYYLEALDRDPGDVRCNNAMGLWLLRKGQFAQAEPYFRKAIETLTDRNPNPYDGEPLFNLGLCLRYQGRDDEAFDQFYKAVWNAAWMDSGYFQLAQIAAKRENWDEALELIDRSLIRNWHNHKARHLKVAILRNLDRKQEALKLIEESLKLDNFNFGVLFEKQLCEPDSVEDLSALTTNNSIETALDYAWAGMYNEAIGLLHSEIDKNPQASPLVFYYKGWFFAQQGKHALAQQTFAEAENCLSDYCFPNQLEAVLALECAMQFNPKGSKAPYYLGNFWYHSRQYSEALYCWETSAKLDSQFPTVWRNLALAYYNKFDLKEQAVKSLENAFALDKTDSRVLMELDQLYKKTGKPIADRIRFLQENHSLVLERDDLYLEQATLYNLSNEFEKAYNMVMYRNFHPWEGGEGKVTGQYLYSLVEMAKKALANNQPDGAVDLLLKTKFYPHNLGEGKLPGAQENDADYWLGVAYDLLGKMVEARKAWEAASTGNSEPAAAWFYNAAPPDKIFYQGMALM